MLTIQIKQLLPYCCYQHFLEFSGQSNKTAWLKKLLNVSVDYRYADLAIALSNHPPDRCTDLHLTDGFTCSVNTVISVICLLCLHIQNCFSAANVTQFYYH